MSKELFIIVSIILQATFVIFDLVYQIKSESKNSKNKLTLFSVLFLILVIVVYSILQVLGLALIPEINWLIKAIQNGYSSFLNIETIQTTTPLSWFILGVVTFYISGFWDYLVHRYFSHSNPFWFTHEYHHLPNKLILALPGLGARPFVVFAVFPAMLGTLLTILFVLTLIGLTSINLMPLVYVLITAQTFILLITHSDFFLKYWWIHNILKYFAITTPQEHEMHHTVDLRGNYGNFTVLWDKIFNIYIDPTLVENQKHQLGLSYDQDFLGVLTLGKIKIPKKYRKLFQIEKYCNIKD